MDWPRAKQYKHLGDAVNHDAMFKRLLMMPAVLRGFFDAFLPEAGRFIDFERGDLRTRRASKANRKDL